MALKLLLFEGNPSKVTSLEGALRYFHDSADNNSGSGAKHPHLSKESQLLPALAWFCNRKRKQEERLFSLFASTISTSRILLTVSSLLHQNGLLTPQASGKHSATAVPLAAIALVPVVPVV